MFRFISKDGFGVYFVECSECSHVTEVSSRAFHTKAYENMRCLGCAEIEGKEDAKDRVARSVRAAEIELLRGRLYGVLYASNEIELRSKLG